MDEKCVFLVFGEDGYAYAPNCGPRKAGMEFIIREITTDRRDVHLSLHCQLNIGNVAYSQDFSRESTLLPETGLLAFKCNFFGGDCKFWLMDMNGNQATDVNGMKIRLAYKFIEP